MARTGPDGKIYGLDGLDPLLWNSSTYLLEGNTGEEFDTALAEFAAQSDDVIRTYSPTQRAMLQRVLWVVFDRAAARGRGVSPEKRENQAKTAKLITRLALSREEIAKLPDTFAETARTKPHPREPKTEIEFKNRFVPFFPDDLLDADGA